MAYSIIAQTNSTTTLADENGNVITVPSRSILDAGTTFNVTKVNNNKATLEDGDGKVYAGVPCIVNLTGTGGGSAVIEELNVTPSTSAQTITASGGTDGYSPVNVAAVDASIDANITAANIVSGKTILGVAGSAIELNGETKTVTPQVYGQTLYPTSPKNAITEITVNAVTSSIDANIQAGNIKKDVTILGVTGSYEGGGSPAGLYREYVIDGGGVLRANPTTTHIMDFTGITTIIDPMLAYTYYDNHSISGVANMSDLVDVSGSYACQYMWGWCTGITSANLSSLTTVSGQNSCQNMFYQCTGLTSVDVSSLTTISGSSACNNMFSYCKFTSINLSSLTTISGSNACTYMFSQCSELDSVNLSSLTTITGSSALNYTFAYCPKLTSLSFPAITTSSFGTRTNQFQHMLDGVPAITLHFPSNVQAKIESLSGYSTTAPFGAVSGSVLFDLPATS